VNLHTKQSQWEKPTEPVYAHSGNAPAGAPPGYDNRSQYPTGPEKSTTYASNNPYGSSQSVNDDEALARKLQAEEEARAHQASSSTRAGQSDAYYNSGAPAQQQPQYSNELPPRDQDRGKSKGGILGKLLGKASSSSRPPQGYGQQGAYPQQYGGYPPQQGYGGYPPQQGYGGYPPQQQYYQQQPPRKTGGGMMGGAGGMALGAGAGLLGGALLMNGIDDMQEHSYEQGYDQGVSL
jgi:hypothetical protein